MSAKAPFERLHDELVSAAARQIAAGRRPGRSRRARTIALVAALVTTGAGAVGWAATTILATGSPVPYVRGAPIAGTKQGAPIAGTIKLLAQVADPDGGADWGLRYWETDRKYACVQVGRVYEGKLGQITDGRVFHEIRPGFVERGLGGCFVQDGAGHAFVAIHTDASRGGRAPQCLTNLVKPMTSYRRRDGRVVPCVKPERTVDFGLLGPNATSMTYKAAGAIGTATPAGGVGAYLVVQRRLKPVIRTIGFRHKDPSKNLRGAIEPYLALTPASQVVRRVVYTAGACRVEVTSSVAGACEEEAGFVPIPQPTVDDVRAPVRAFPAADGSGIRVRFRAREAVVDGRSTYTIELHPKGKRGWTGTSYEHNLAAGALVRTTLDPYVGYHGVYRVVVRYNTLPPRPGPFPVVGAAQLKGGKLVRAPQGVLVGETTVTAP